jgi:type VI secretion system protein ImpL
MKLPITTLRSPMLLPVAGVLGSLLAAGMVLVFDWPWWAGLFIMLLLAGIASGGFLLRQIWLRRREIQLGDAAGESDQAKAFAQEKRELNKLQQLWENAIATLRHSSLGKHGNPLYTLPWYLMMGATGCGKSSALESARLSSPLRDGNREDMAGGTAQCEWFFYDQAVVIDSAGRYTVPVNGERDRQEWQQFLALMMKYRRKEPLSAVLVAVAADRLLDPGQEQLKKDAGMIRQRIDELSRAGGVTIPVYVLVTKCDQIRGMHRFCGELPSGWLEQPMGSLNRELPQHAAQFSEQLLNTIDQRLRRLRLQLLHRPQSNESKESQAEIVLFPEEFGRLRQGLLDFITLVFGANPYQETPTLRGVFFGSARRSSPPAQAPPGSGQETGALPAHGKGMFLHDLFAKVLPGDRSLPAPTRRHLQWRALTCNLGLTSWVIAVVALCGLLSFSFVKNLTTIRDFPQDLSKTVQPSGDLLANLAALERYRQEIVRIEEKNRHWWVPRFGLAASMEVEQALKERFCRQFRELILSPTDRQMAAGVAATSPATPDDLYGQYLVHLVRRINILRTLLKEKNLVTLQESPQPTPLPLLGTPAAPGTTEARRTFGILHLSFLVWRKEAGATRKEIAELQSMLDPLLRSRGYGLQWSVAWVDRQSGLGPVSLRDFWGGSAAVAGAKQVPPSFTRKGKETLENLIRELEAAAPDPAPVAAQMPAFASWYRSAAWAAWREFCAGFSRGEEGLRGQPEWQQAASGMSSEQGPYFALFRRLVLELEPMAGGGPLPLWLQQVGEFQAARVQSLVQHAVTIKAAEGSKKILTSIRKNVGQEAGAHKLEAQLATTKASQDYCAALSAITATLASRSQSFQLAGQTFDEEPATGKSPFFAAALAAHRLKTGMAGSAADPTFCQLLDGPREFLWSYLRKESAAQLQGLWEEQVLAGTLGMTSQQATTALLGPEGLAWRFVKGPAAPFLSRGLSGYSGKEALGGKIPFEAGLFSFLGKGVKAQAALLALSRPQNFSVGFRGLPTDANAEAKIRPHATRMEIQCGAGIQSLVNNNYPVGKTLSWSPEACGDVTFQIEIGNLVLTRHYLGQQGFPEFLKDLRGGRRTFSAREFPGEKQALERMGVRSITVNYQIIGSGPVLQQADTLSGQAPRSIARGWAR